MSTKMQVEWPRSRVLGLLSKGDSQSEIANTLQVDLPIISRDVYFLRQQAKSNIERYIDERLPEEYEKCLVGLNAITKEAWNTSEQTEDKREKIQALSLAKECYSMKLELLTNATVLMMLLGLNLLANSKRNRNRLWIIPIKMAKNQTSLIMMKMKIS
jgi:hypothetical protein